MGHLKTDYVGVVGVVAKEGESPELVLDVDSDPVRICLTWGQWDTVCILLDVIRAHQYGVHVVVSEDGTVSASEGVVAPLTSRKEGE